ncbi:MAG: acetyl-CoA carboxylase biotin carboxyl carrier protein subunit, partial [Chitinophagaceae bacterium]
MADGNKTYKVKANEFLFSFTHTEIIEADLVKISSTEFNLIRDRRSVNAKLVETDSAGKKVKIEMEGEIV